jgi:hypothetical protein
VSGPEDRYTRDTLAYERMQQDKLDHERELQWRQQVELSRINKFNPDEYLGKLFIKCVLLFALGLLIGYML